MDVCGKIVSSCAVWLINYGRGRTYNLELMVGWFIQGIQIFFTEHLIFWYNLEKTRKLRCYFHQNFSAIFNLNNLSKNFIKSEDQRQFWKPYKQKKNWGRYLRSKTEFNFVGESSAMATTVCIQSLPWVHLSLIPFRYILDDLNNRLLVRFWNINKL